MRAMAKISPFKFLQEVRAEGEKVTWPTRKETTVTTMMVVMVVSLRVGQVTFSPSARTSCRNLNGLNFAIARTK